jgi:hypothetical protein
MAHIHDHPAVHRTVCDARIRLSDYLRPHPLHLASKNDGGAAERTKWTERQLDPTGYQQAYSRAIRPRNLQVREQLQNLSDGLRTRGRADPVKMRPASLLPQRVHYPVDSGRSQHLPVLQRTNRERRRSSRNDGGWRVRVHH